MPPRQRSELTETELLERVTQSNLAIDTAKQQLQAAVDAARAAGVSWSKIATACGMAGRAGAQARFSDKGQEANRRRVANYQAGLRKAARKKSPK